jgi:hypothetical protein
MRGPGCADGLPKNERRRLRDTSIKVNVRLYRLVLAAHVTGCRATPEGKAGGLAFSFRVTYIRGETAIISRPGSWALCSVE